jgi:hypothetical protein
VALGAEPAAWDPIWMTAMMVLLLMAAAVVPAVRIARQDSRGVVHV